MLLHFQYYISNTLTNIIITSLTLETSKPDELFECDWPYGGVGAKVKDVKVVLKKGSQFFLNLRWPDVHRQSQ